MHVLPSLPDASAPPDAPMQEHGTNRTVDADDPAVPSFAMNTASRLATGVAGIAAVVLLFAGQFVGAIGSRTEPAFDSSTREIVAFLGSLRSVAAALQEV